MSQFLLCFGRKPFLDAPLDVEAVKARYDDFLARAEAYFIGSGMAVGDGWAILDADTQCTDTLFTEAQKAVTAPMPIESTRLGELLMRLCEQRITCVMWYGSDWEDLDELQDGCPQLLEAVTRELRKGPGEIYLIMQS